MFHSSPTIATSQVIFRRSKLLRPKRLQIVSPPRHKLSLQRFRSPFEFAVIQSAPYEDTSPRNKTCQVEAPPDFEPMKARATPCMSTMFVFHRFLRSNKRQCQPEMSLYMCFCFLCCFLAGPIAIQLALPFLPAHRLIAGCDARRGLKTIKPVVPPAPLIERS